MQTAFTVLSIAIVLDCLVMCVSIWWMLVSGEVEEYRRAFREARMQLRSGCKQMLRKWAEDE